VESVSEHPLGAAIVKAAGARGLITPVPQEVSIVPGRGIAGTVNGRYVRVGAADWQEGVVAMAGLAHAAQAISAAAATPVLLSVDGRPAALLAIADAPRPDALRAVSDWQSDGVQVEVLSGDAPTTVAAVASALGIVTARGGASPADKVATVTALESAGRRVAMVGDGLNDAAALARATAGIAMGTGSDLTVGTADVVVLRPSVSGAVDALRLARATRRVIRQNLGWALGYNVLALPAAAGVFATSLGWRLTPMLASALMVLSSVGVIANSLRLKLLRPR
jgi:P-type Cu+ transporter